MMSLDRVLLETSSLTQPGSDRGLGRYTRALRAGYRHDSSLCMVEIGSGTHRARMKDIHSHSVNRQSIFHSTSAYGLPPIKSTRWICSIQDIIPLDLDGYSRYGLRARLAFNNARRSDLIIANSEYTAMRISERLRYPAASIAQLPLPIDPNFSGSERVGRDRREKYFSALVDLRITDSRKRVHWLGPIAEGLSRIGVELRVAGRGLENLATVAKDAVPVDTPTDADLAEFYSRSLCFVYTTGYEGQGLPPLEAMACGTPVIAFSNTSVTEMVGSGQILLDDPNPWECQDLSRPIPGHAVSELVSHAEYLISDTKRWECVSRNASLRAEDFSNSAFEEKLHNIVRKVLER